MVSVYGASSTFTAATVGSGSIPKKGTQEGAPNVRPEAGRSRDKKTAWKNMKLTILLPFSFFIQHTSRQFKHVGHLASYFKNFDQKCGILSFPKFRSLAFCFCDSFFVNPCWLVNVTPIQWVGSYREPKHVILVVPGIPRQGHIHV